MIFDQQKVKLKIQLTKIKSQSGRNTQKRSNSVAIINEMEILQAHSTSRPKEGWVNSHKKGMGARE